MYADYAKKRDEKGLRDADISRIASIPKSTLSEWKAGRSCPKYDKLLRIAAALDCSIHDLHGHQEPISVELDTSTEDAHDLALYTLLVAAYKEASPDTQAAVRAILHLEG